MPSYLDFDSTKRFRDFVISKTINHPDGPQTFNSGNYSVSELSSFPNIEQPDLDANRENDLQTASRFNVFKPSEYFITENLNTLPRKANLSLYPYFSPKSHTLVGILKNDDYSSESELLKLAAYNIKSDPNGAIRSRISQNLNRATNGRIRLLDALNGNTSTAVNIVTGKEPIIDYDYSITTANTGIGKTIDFLQVVSGVEFPWSEIPGDYLSNPLHEYNYKTTKTTEVGKFLEDSTGALGSMIGIQRRETESRKPSDLMIEYLGLGQKLQLYRLLSYSKYAPNYTTTARSQNTSKVFNFIDNLTQGVKKLIGTEAPEGVSYIGDDRGNDVKYAMGDFNDRHVRGPYYLSLMFDETATRLFENEKNFSDGGSIGGSLTWVSTNSKNKLGSGNKEWESESSYFNKSLSTSYTFKEGSILGYTQEILNSMPSNGGGVRNHISNAIDQTARIFQDGDKYISKGSAIQYVDKFGNKTGVEYSRVWTKDRPYLNHSDLMKKSGNIRKFDSSVVSNTYNLNIAPISNGNKDFEVSTNIHAKSAFYGGQPSVKKYMFSIENLVWKNSTEFGKTVLDLPYAERGPNGGRIMWFPPYDLSISEQNAANWETNKFIGRPEPIYTYQGAERNASLSFRIVVDHPSILNLLVREEFKNMSEEETDNYINAVFAGSQDIEFYSLIQKYPMLDKNDLNAILKYLDKTGETNKDGQIGSQINTITSNVPISTVNGSLKTSTNFNKLFYFAHNDPKSTDSTYKGVYDSNMGNETSKQEIKSRYLDLITKILSDPNFSTKAKNDHDIKLIWGGNIKPENIPEIIQNQSQSFDKVFQSLDETYVMYENTINNIKTKLQNNAIENIVVTIQSSATIYGSDEDNMTVTNNRSWSMINDIISRIKSSDSTFLLNSNQPSPIIVIKLKDLGYENNKGTITFSYTNYGENSTVPVFGKTPKEWNFMNDDMHIISPISFLLRCTHVNIDYTLNNKEQNNNSTSEDIKSSKIKPDNPPTYEPTPSLYTMKKTIMKTLQESYYFKKLEETDPVVFKSLKDKLKYFHPAFHSTTPEGLNSRLTFLHQCIRPGNTIKESDGSSVARNTTFGPPPICVLRIGDFYHSKVIIKDLNITFEENLWDINPEGIGMQPMIAKVTLQLAFIGGQGLEKPIARLQNALSSNFYANTEMYDERSESSGGTIDGKDEKAFSTEFLEKIKTNYENNINNINNPVSTIIQNTYIGEKGDENTLSYNTLILDLTEKINSYEEGYKIAYNDVMRNNGDKLSSLIFSTKYRNISKYDVYSNIGTIDKSIDLFGLYGKGNNLSQFTSKIYNESESLIKGLENPSTIIDLNNTIPTKTLKTFNLNLVAFLTKTMNEVTNGLESNVKVKSLEKLVIPLINSLDKLNFLVKYGYDVTINQMAVNQGVFSEPLNSSALYDTYKNNINNVVSDFTTLNSDIGESFDIINNNLTINDLKEILKVVLSKDGMIDKVKKLYTGTDEEEVRKNIENKLSNFITAIPEKTFNLKKATSTNPNIEYTLINEVVITDTNITDEVKKLFSSNVAITDKLNYYKK